MDQRPLIVVVPGIGGSVLARVGEDAAGAVWDASTSEIVKGVVNPEAVER